MKEAEFELFDGSILKCSGPHDLREAKCPIFVATIGDDIARSNELIDRLMQFTISEPDCWGGPDSEVTCLVSGSSPWTILQFVDCRMEWVVSKLNEIIKIYCINSGST